MSVLYSKRKTSFIIITLVFVGIISCLGCKKSDIKGMVSPEPIINPVKIMFSSDQIDVKQSKSFTSDIELDTLDQKIAAYTFEITYPDDLIEIDKSIGEENKFGATAGSDGYFTAANIVKPGLYKIAGFDVNGKGPGNSLKFLSFHWIAKKTGTATITLKVLNMVDETTKKISETGTSINQSVSIN